jgi:hypothetical protein
MPAPPYINSPDLVMYLVTWFAVRRNTKLRKPFIRLMAVEKPKSVLV